MGMFFIITTIQLILGDLNRLIFDDKFLVINKDLKNTHVSYWSFTDWFMVIFALQICIYLVAGLFTTYWSFYILHMFIFFLRTKEVYSFTTRRILSVLFSSILLFLLLKNRFQ